MHPTYHQPVAYRIPHESGEVSPRRGPGRDAGDGRGQSRVTLDRFGRRRGTLREQDVTEVLVVGPQSASPPFWRGRAVSSTTPHASTRRTGWRTPCARASP